MLAYVNVRQRLHILRECHIEARTELDSPSWVPNWASDDSSLNFILNSSRAPAGISGARTRYIAPDILEVTGVQCGTVCSVGGVASGEANTLLTSIRQWEPDGLLTSQYVTGGSLLDAFLDVVFAGCIREAYPGYSHYPSLGLLRRAYMDAVSGDPRKFLDYLTGNGPRDVLMIKTSQGLLGLTLPGARTGE